MHFVVQLSMLCLVYCQEYMYHACYYWRVSYHVYYVAAGRTGVLIACYLVYSSRISPTEAIEITREKRYVLYYSWNN